MTRAGRTRDRVFPFCGEMFERLSDRLDGVLGQLRQRGVITEKMLKDGLREVRRALLEADVNYAVARDFLKRVETRAIGEDVLKAVRPGDQIVKIVHDELVELLLTLTCLRHLIYPAWDYSECFLVYILTHEMVVKRSFPLRSITLL